MNKLIKFTTIVALALSITLPAAAQAGDVTYPYANVDGLRIFYREAGNVSKPTIVLLHGFPTSSHEFRDLIALLEPNFHVIAPDYPGMGHSEAPLSGEQVTFPMISKIMESFLGSLGQKKLVFYMTDFGGPIGMKIVLHHPEWVSGLIFQNALVSIDGMSAARIEEGEKPAPAMTPALRAQAGEVVSLKTALFLYRTGARNAGGLNPDAWTDDAAALSDNDSRRVMIDLTLDARNNRMAYPSYQAYLREQQPKTLILWGKNDPVFGPAGWEAIHRLVANSEFDLYNTGHFALEENSLEIAQRITSVFSTP